MDSTAPTAATDSKIINELLLHVTHGLDNPNNPYGLINHQGNSANSPERLIKH
jgi:hypothetical protein